MDVVGLVLGAFGSYAPFVLLLAAVGYAYYWGDQNNLLRLQQVEKENRERRESDEQKLRTSYLTISDLNNRLIAHTEASLKLFNTLRADRAKWEEVVDAKESAIADLETSVSKREALVAEEQERLNAVATRAAKLEDDLGQRTRELSDLRAEHQTQTQSLHLLREDLEKIAGVVHGMDDAPQELKRLMGPYFKVDADKARQLLAAFAAGPTKETARPLRALMGLPRSDLEGICASESPFVLCVVLRPEGRPLRFLGAVSRDEHGYRDVVSLQVDEGRVLEAAAYARVDLVELPSLKDLSVKQRWLLWSDHGGYMHSDELHHDLPGASWTLLDARRAQYRLAPANVLSPTSGDPDPVPVTTAHEFLATISSYPIDREEPLFGFDQAVVILERQTDFQLDRSAGLNRLESELQPPVRSLLEACARGVGPAQHGAEITASDLGRIGASVLAGRFRIIQGSRRDGGYEVRADSDDLRLELVFRQAAGVWRLERFAELSKR